MVLNKKVEVVKIVEEELNVARLDKANLLCRF